MTQNRWGFWAFGAIGIALAVSGIVLLTMQAPVPAMLDRAGFELGVKALWSTLEAAEAANYDAASKAYFALYDAHETNKYLLLDAGLSLLSWGAILLLLAAGIRFDVPMSNLIFRTHRFPAVPLVAASAALLFAGAGISGALTLQERGSAPPWADSVAIPIGGAVVIAPIIFLLLTLIAGVPHVKSGSRGQNLFATGRKVDVSTIAGYVIYCPLALGVVWLAAISVASPESAVAAPALALTLWLMLHARAVASA